MITLRKMEYVPALSVVCGRAAIPTGENAPKFIPTPAGECFLQALSEWNPLFPLISVDAIAIMPDHIHLCINVNQYLQNGLSRAIASLMGRTSKAFHAHFPHLADVPFFSKGFNDRIAYTPEQYETQIQYVVDNPRRLLIKRMHPDLFFKRWIISVNDMQLMAIGNIFLLKNPHIQVVRFSRRYSAIRVQDNREAWELCIENNGVLISPFIHPVEKEMKRIAMSVKANIIRINENGFSDKFTPSKSEFELLSEGKLLLVAPNEFKSEKEELKYAKAQRLNFIAELLAGHPEGMRLQRADR